MTDRIQEECVRLVAGWLRKVERFSSGAERISPEELPPGFTLSPETFIDRQHAFAREARALVEARLNQERRAHADAATIASRRRARLSEQVAAGNVSVQDANALSRELTQKMDRARAAAEECAERVRLLRGEKAAELPDMPLYKYALAWDRFRTSPEEADETSPDPSPPSLDRKTSGRRLVRGTRGMERSDRLAVLVALVLSLFIAVAGYQYVHVWGRLHMEVTQVAEYRYKVTFTNSFGDPVLILAPYDGRGLMSGGERHYGVYVELINQDGAARPMTSPEMLWTYKDQPAHLYGTILVSPLSSEELLLQMPAGSVPDDAATLRLTLYRPPHRRYRHATISLGGDAAGTSAP